MSKLEDIFKITDNKERMKALLEYARSLKLQVGSAKKTSGEYSDNELAVMIYKMENSKKNQKIQNVAILFAGMFIMMALFFAIVGLFFMMQDKPLVPTNTTSQATP